MKINAFSSGKIYVLLLIVILLVLGVMACEKSTSKTTSGTTYKLTHDLGDLEYVISWDIITAQIPGIGVYDKQEGFAGRGNAGGFFYLDSNSPAMWIIVRSVTMRSEENRFHDFNILMWFFETEKEFDEHMKSEQMQGIPVQKEGDLLTAVVETKTTEQSAKLVVAGNHICILITDTSSSEELLFFSEEDLTELLPTIKSKISSIEITPLRFPKIPRRIAPSPFPGLPTY